MSRKHYLVTGGSGFIGSALVHRLLRDGHRVRVLDDHSRGHAGRLQDVIDDVEFVAADICDGPAVLRACSGVDAVSHLAYINGTERFYTQPDRVLEVAVLGMMNMLQGCAAAGVAELALVSSSEVYQTPPVVPTPENVPLCVPDVLNPRFSYGGGKIISELLALHWGAARLRRVLVVRPHNVYGPDMGFEHVIPQFTLRLRDLCAKTTGPVQFPIQGTGTETRAFVHIDDFTEAFALVLERGAHRDIFHLGTDEEVSIAALAREVAWCFQREIELVPGPLQPGSTARRCPNIANLRALGFQPRISLRAGLPEVVRWYCEQPTPRPAAVVLPNSLAA